MKQTPAEELAQELRQMAFDVIDIEQRASLAKVKVGQFSSLTEYMSPEAMAALEQFSVKPHAFDVTVAAHYAGKALQAIKWLHERHVRDCDTRNWATIAEARREARTAGVGT
jgi:hypothetical protein